MDWKSLIVLGSLAVVVQTMAGPEPYKSPKDFYSCKKVLIGQVNVTDEATYGKHIKLGDILEKVLGERPSQTVDRWLSSDKSVSSTAAKPKPGVKGEVLPVPPPMATSIEGHVSKPANP